MTLADRISRGVKASFAARVVHIVANAVLLVALTRYLLTPAGYGRLSTALAALGVAVLFGTLGVPKATARYLTEYVETDDRQVPHLLRHTTVVVVGLTVLVALVVAAVGGPLAEALGDGTLAPFFVVGAAYVVGKGVTEHLKITFQGFNRVVWSALVGAVNGVARVTLAVGFVLLGFGALGALAGYVVAFLLAAAVGLVVLYWKFYRTYDPADEREEGLLRHVLEYSVPTAATRASVVVDSKVDTLLLAALAGPVAVGFYTLARQISEVCIVPAQSLGFTITPTFGEQKAADQIDRAARLYERALENVLLLYVPAGVGLVLVAEPAVRYVFTAEYLGAVPIVRLFSLFVLVRAVHKITGSGLDFLGLARIRAIARGASALGNVGLNLLLIPRYGALGAGVATVVTYSLYTLVNVYYVHREFSLRLGRLASTFARVLVVAVAMGGSVALALPHVQGVVTLAATITLGGAVWATLSVLSGLVDPAEVRAFLG